MWLQTVPEAIVAATSPQERKRQECIYELIYTEQDFVRDLQYCQDVSTAQRMCKSNPYLCLVLDRTFIKQQRNTRE